MVVNTASSLADLGTTTSLMVSGSGHAYLDERSSAVNLHVLKEAPQPAQIKATLKDIRPDIVVTCKLVDDERLVRSLVNWPSRPRLLFRVGNPIGHRLAARGLGRLRLGWRRSKLRKLYHQADGYIAVSQGIAEDLVRHLQIPSDRVDVLPNPTVTGELFSRATEGVPHAWFQSGAPPVILSVGALRQQKDFGTLINAFAMVRSEVDSRLVILGEGRQRARLMALAQRLGIADSVDLPGWVSNPHAYMSKASAYVLSSLWEGSPNSLVEAAALGVPLVATDCMSGPREILDNGRYGYLVPTQDVSSLANALQHALQSPLDPAWTREAASPYRAEKSALAYQQALSRYV